MKRTLFKALPALALATGSANAAIVFQPEGIGSGGFGQVSGATVHASTVAPGWTPGLAGGSPYIVSEVTFTKNQEVDTGVGNLWIGVYLSSGVLANRADVGNATYLGSSTNSVDFNAAANGAALTWSFAGVEFTPTATSHLHFIFQDSADEVEEAAARVNGTLNLLRFGNEPSNTFTDLGAGVLHGGSDVGTVENRVPVMTLTVIPEPGSAMLGLLGALALLRRRR